MRGNPATRLWVRTIPFVVTLALAASCSSPNPETASAAPAEKASLEPEKPATSKPAPTPVATTPPVTQGDPTPAETPLPPPPPPAPAAAAGDAKATPAVAEPDALKWMEQQEAKRVEYPQNLAKLAADRDAAKTFLAKAERDLLAFKNPYLARPNLTPGEASEIEGMNGVDRVKWAESRVADAISSLESAQKAYDDAKASPPPD